jgi:hypothetical protein
METVKETRRISTLRVPKTSEVIVRIPVENGVGADGITEETERTDGVSLIKIEGNQAITGILHLNEEDVGYR